MRSTCIWHLASVALACWGGIFLSPAFAVHRVVYEDQGKRRSVSGRVLIEDRSANRLLETDEGGLLLISGDSVVKYSDDGVPFQPISRDALATRLVDRLPTGFQTYQTAHYLVAYDTSREYARWVGSMLERLNRAFTNYWTRSGFDLHSPEFPLVVVIHADVASYRREATPDLADAAMNVVGYYSLRTNQVRMFDLTGAEQLLGAGRRRSSLKEINFLLSTPAAVPLVSTVVHEATHQIAFNNGMMKRFAPLPLWLVEGMAVYFEAPDLSSGRGWRGIGKVNYPRLQTFRSNAARWNSTSLAAILSSDKLFRNARSALDAYADAWALNYYLIRHRKEAYWKYVRAMSQKSPFEEDSPEERLKEFRQHFGDLPTLQRDWLRRMAKLD